MSRRLLVNDMLSALPDHRTFWNDLQDWFGMVFVGGDYTTLAEKADTAAQRSYASVADAMPSQWEASLIIRNASYFGPMNASKKIPTICLLQDIFEEGPARQMQEAVIRSSRALVWNSEFTRSRYGILDADAPPISQTFTLGSFISRVIPLPVDFTVFEPGNHMGLQQALSLPDGCICWIGACREAGHVKGWDRFIQIARINPDLSFVAVLKDAEPDSIPPNVRAYVRLTHEELVKVIGACRVGLCTSRTESQHLAGIEMGACGLTVVAPRVGVYWHRNDMPGAVLDDKAEAATYADAIRAALDQPGDADSIRAYWRKEFDPSVIKTAWAKLIEEVEAK